MTIVTADLSDFGAREITEAIDLLKAYQKTNLITSGLSLNFNKNTGYVFLSDEEYRVWMEDDGNLKEWLHCHNCGSEGLEDDIDTWAKVKDLNDLIEDCVCPRVHDADEDREDCSCGAFDNYHDDDEDHPSDKRRCYSCSERVVVYG